MTNNDLPAVVAIENASYAEPWAPYDFVETLRVRNNIGMVATVGDLFVGFFVYALGKQQIEVLNFAVAPGARLHSVGRQMIECLVKKLSPYRRSKLVFPVNENNLPGQLFLRSCGLRAVGWDRSCFIDRDDASVAAILFETGVGGDAGQQVLRSLLEGDGRVVSVE